MATTTSSTHTHAGPALDNRRIAAGLIDLAAPLLAAGLLVVTDLLTPATALVLVAWTLYYFFALESGGGQTLGKRAMNLKVVSADGAEPTMRQYAMRTLVRVIDTPAVGLVVMLVTGDKRQRLGDLAAGTSVVDAEGSHEADTAQMDAFDAAHMHARTAPPAEPKAKRSRPGLGGPELKMPSFGRSKGPKAPKEPKPTKPPKPAKAAKAPKPARAAKSGRPTLGGPELKMPSLRRSKAPKPAKAAKSGRPTLGGPEIKMPSFGRKKKQEPVSFEPGPPPPAPPAAEQPPEPEPEVTPFDPFGANAPEPSVEVVSHGDPSPELEPPARAEPPLPEIMERQEPEVEVVRDQVEEPPAPQPARPTIPAIPAIPADEHELPDTPPEPASPPEPEHVEGVRDDGSSRVHVKPIETVSAMELLMREAEDQDRQRS